MALFPCLIELSFALFLISHNSSYPSFQMELRRFLHAFTSAACSCPLPLLWSFLAGCRHSSKQCTSHRAFVLGEEPPPRLGIGWEVSLSPLMALYAMEHCPLISIHMEIRSHRCRRNNGPPPAVLAAAHGVLFRKHASTLIHILLSSSCPRQALEWHDI